MVQTTSFRIGSLLNELRAGAREYDIVRHDLRYRLHSVKCIRSRILLTGCRTAIGDLLCEQAITVRGPHRRPGSGCSAGTRDDAHHHRQAEQHSRLC